MNKLKLGSITMVGKNFTFTTPNLSLYSTAVQGQLVEPEIQITISDSIGKLNPYTQSGFYNKYTLQGETVIVYDYYENVIFTGFVSRHEARGNDLILFAQSPLAFGMARAVNLSTTNLYPSDAIYLAMVNVGLEDYIDKASFEGAAAYYKKYPQLLKLETTNQDIKLVDIINTISQLTTTAVCANEYGKIEFKILGSFVPLPSITLTTNDLLTEPSVGDSLQAFNAYDIQVLNDNIIANNSMDGDSFAQYGLLKYNYTPSAGVFVSDYGSAKIFGERKMMYNQYPLRKIVLGIKNNILAPIHNEINLSYVNESYDGIYTVVSKKYDAYVTELTLLELPINRISTYIQDTSTISTGYGFGVYNTNTWGR